MSDVAVNPGRVASLADHEEVIERGLSSFVDVGNALLAVKVAKLYLEGGYSSFEDYCQRRWCIGRAHGYRLIVAAQTTAALARDLPGEVSPRGDILPASEKQVRPLAAVPDESKAEVWTAAVEAAGGEQPTAAQVSAAVADHLTQTPAGDEWDWDDAEPEPEPLPPRPAPTPEQVEAQQAREHAVRVSEDVRYALLFRNQLVTVATRRDLIDNYDPTLGKARPTEVSPDAIRSYCDLLHVLADEWEASES